MNLTRPGNTWWLAVFAAVVLGTGLGARGLNEPDEGRFAEIGREMAGQSNWLMPHLGGLPHLQKPPLLYWLTALSLRTFGIHDWAARLPTALAAFGTLLLVLHLAGLLFGPPVRWKAGLILLSSGLFFMLGRLLTTDMLLTFWITAAVTSFVHYTVRRTAPAALLFYLCLGFGFLTKGPMAFLVPLCAVIPWAVAHGRNHPAPGWRWQGWLGAPLALAVGGSWFLLLFRQYPQLVDYFVRYEFLDRIASNVHKRSEPAWFYTAVLIGGLLPWTVLIPGLLRDRWARRREPRSPVFWLFAGWIFIPLLILHLVTSKLPTYLLPLFPPLALVVAHGWHQNRVSVRPPLRGLSALFAVAALGGLLALALNSPVYRGTTIHLTIGSASGLLALAGGWFLLFLRARPEANRDRLLADTGLMMVATLLCLTSQADHLLRGGNASMKPIAEAVRAEEQRHGPAVVFSCNIQAYGLDFYLQRILHRTVPKANLVLPTPPDIAPLIVSDPVAFLADPPGHRLVLVKANRLAVDPLFTGAQIVARSGSMVLVRR